MAFDIQIAIDRMSTSPVSHEIRSRYPELAHIFDEVDRTRYAAENYEDPAELADQLAYMTEQAQRADAAVNEAADRFAQLRDMALVLERMTVERRTDDLIRQISRLADDAVYYFETVHD